jgi:putative DNA primase/helicase
VSGDTIADFLAAMVAAGVRPAEPISQAIGDGSLIRFRCEGDKPGRRNGWAVLHLDGRPAGSFGWYKGGVRQTWRADRQEPLSASERDRLRREWRETSRRREADRRAAQETATSEAERMWAASALALPAHPYLVRKGMTGEGLRQLGDTLLAPMRDVAGRLWNLQRIRPDGFKLFLKGGRTKGLLFEAGCRPDGRSAPTGRCARDHPFRTWRSSFKLGLGMPPGASLAYGDDLC